MKVIRVNVETGDVQEVEMDMRISNLKLSLKWSKLMGDSSIHELMNQKLFVYISDEGLHKQHRTPETTKFFSINNSECYPGDCIVTGMGEKFQPTDVTITVDEVKEMVKIYTYQELICELN